MYKKDCYSPSSYIDIHYSHGAFEKKSNMNYLHYDKDLIIEFYRIGESEIHIEGNHYHINEGDMVILNPDEIHVSTRKDGSYFEKIVLHIKDTLLSPFGGDQKTFFDTILKKPKGMGNLIPAQTVKDLCLDRNIEQSLSLAEKGTFEAQMLITCKTIELLSELSKITETVDKTNQPLSANKTVNQIIDYINKHYTENITLEFLSEKFHFSKYHIAHLFKSNVGISPYDYLILRRLYVCNNLIRANYTVKEACYSVGFHNYSNFYRLYKKHLNITPQQFKGQLKPKSP